MRAGGVGSVVTAVAGALTNAILMGCFILGRNLGAILAYAERRTTTEPPQRVKVSFKLPYRCSFGQELAIVGSGEALGNWDVKHAKRMEWTAGDVWQVEFEVTTG